MHIRHFPHLFIAAFACNLSLGEEAENPSVPAMVSAAPLEDKRPAFPITADNAELLKSYDAAFPTSVQPVGNPGPGVPQEQWHTAVNRVRIDLEIKRDSQGNLTGKPILGEGGIGWHAFEQITRGLSDTFWKSNAEQRKAMEPVITDCLQHFNNVVGPQHQSWSQWANYGSARPQFRFSFWLAHIAPMEIGDAYIEEIFHLAALEIGSPRVDLQMDHLKGYAAMALNMPSAVRDPGRRLALARKAHDYAQALMLGEGNFTREGGIMHHGIWHYYYARYSTFEFFRAVVSLHKAGFYFSPAAYDRIRRVGAAAAVSMAGSNLIYPLNGNGRSGQILPMQDATKLWIWAATSIGSYDDPKRPDPDFASIHVAWWPEDPFSKELKEQGIQPAPVPDTNLTMNIGATTVHRRNGWNIQTAGLSPASGKHEIYSWVQYNNYSQYARWGTHIITHPSYALPENEGGYMANHGFNWAFIPGATCPATPPHRLIVRRKNSHIQNGAVGGGCTLENDGMWIQHQIWGPGAFFKKSAFFFGERATYITSNVSAQIPADATEGEKTIHTTLAQWPVKTDSAPLIIKGRPITSEPSLATTSLDSLTTIIDSKGHAYIIEPNSAAKLKYRRGKQTYPMLADGYLKAAPSPFDWHGPTINGKWFNDQNLKEAENLVTPREGDFEIAYIEHSLSDGSDAAGSAYHILPMAESAGAAKFNQELAQEDPPCRILQRDGHAHVLWDRDTSTYAYAIFDGTETTHGPLVSMGTPGTVMFRKQKDGGFRVALASPLKKELFDTEITVRGHFEVTPSTGDTYEVTHLEGNTTRIKWMAHSYIATTLHLKAKPGAKTDGNPK